MVDKNDKPMSLRILVIDDDRYVQDSLRRLLQFDSHQVQLASSAQEALELVAKSTYDLVMTDYEMPGVKGDQLALNLKAVAPNQPIILMTAYGEQLRSVSNPLTGVDFVLGKPFKLDDLRQAISQVLAKP